LLVGPTGRREAPENVAEHVPNATATLSVANPAPGAGQEVFAGVMFTTVPWNEPPTSPTAFPMRGLRELYIHTAWRGLAGSHLELRKYYAPNGSLYSQKWVAATSESRTPLAYQGPKDLPHTPTAQVARQLADGSFWVTDYLEVEGTWISEHNLAGQWRLEVYLESHSAPAGQAAFRLE
ncbi:MAG: hypothetical protein V1750_06555, partial [Acidobacteriota bacterium]